MSGSGAGINYRGGLRAAAATAGAMGAAAGGGGGLPQWQPPRTQPQRDPMPTMRDVQQMRGMGRRPGGGLAKAAGGAGGEPIPPPPPPAPPIPPMTPMPAGGGLAETVPVALEAAAPAAVEGLGAAATAAVPAAVEGIGAAAAAAAPAVVEALPVALALLERGGRVGYASGGLAEAGPQGRMAVRRGPAGLIHSATAGRADLVPARLRRGSYIIPADVVSGLGEGNTLAGAKMLHASLPEAAAMAAAGPVAHAAGGLAGEDPDELEVRLSGGEYQVAPDQVLALGRGDVQAGAKALDELVHAVRAKARRALDTMPPPK